MILCVNILVQNQCKATFLQIYTTFPSQDGVVTTFLLDLIQNAGLLFRSSNLEQKRKLINLVFQNLSLKDGKAQYTVKKPYELFLDEAKCSKWPGC